MSYVAVQMISLADFFLLIGFDRNFFRRNRLRWTQLAGY